MPQEARSVLYCLTAGSMLTSIAAACQGYIIIHMASIGVGLLLLAVSLYELAERSDGCTNSTGRR